MAKTSTYTISSLKTVKGDPELLGSLMDGSITELDLSGTSIEKLDNYALYSKKSLTKIILPETLKYIGNSSSYRSNKLSEVEGGNILYLGRNAMETECSTRTNIDLSQVDLIEDYNRYILPKSYINSRATILSEVVTNPTQVDVNGCYYLPSELSDKYFLNKINTSTYGGNIVVDPECKVILSKSLYNSASELTLPAGIERIGNSPWTSSPSRALKINIPSLDDWFKIDFAQYYKIINDGHKIHTYREKTGDSSASSFTDMYGYDSYGFSLTSEKPLYTKLYIDGVQVDNVTEITIPDTAGIGSLASFTSLETLNVNCPKIDGHFGLPLLFASGSFSGGTRHYGYYDTGKNYTDTYYDYSYKTSSYYSDCYIPSTLRNINVLNDEIPSSFFRTYGSSYSANILNSTLTFAKPITKLGDQSFYSQSSSDFLKEIPLGEGLEEIPYQCFYNCNGLTELHFPKSLKRIAAQAFQGCKNLKTISSENVEELEYIGYYAFYNLTALEDFPLDGDFTIKTQAFYNCTSLAADISNFRGTVARESFYKTKLTGTLNFNDITTGTDFSTNSLPFQGTSITRVSLRQLKRDTIFVSDSLEEIFLEEGFSSKTRDNEDFVASLTYLFPSSASVYQYTPSNPSVIAYKTMEKVPGSGMSGGSNVYFPIDKTIKNVIFNNSEIPAILFYDLPTEKITLTKDITEIGEQAFLNCKYLTEIDGTFNEVETLSNEAFSVCSLLEHIPAFPKLKEIGSLAFNYCTQLKEIHLPNTVTSIGAEAFRRCTSLKSIVIPEGVTTMGTKVFEGCYGNLTIYCEVASIPNLWITNWNDGCVVYWGGQWHYDENGDPVPNV